MRLSLPTLLFSMLTVVATMSSPVYAATIVEMVGEGCKTEIETYCKDVTLGEGRLAACLYAHGDKLSGRCNHALMKAINKLERFVEDLRYVANECATDIEQQCANVEPGEGRIIQCLTDKSSKISKDCNQALSDVGAK